MGAFNGFVRRARVGGALGVGADVAGASPGAVLYATAAGALAADATLAYDPDGTAGALATPGTLYVGGGAGGTVAGTLALYDPLAAGAAAPLTAAGGALSTPALTATDLVATTLTTDALTVTGAFGLSELAVSRSVSSASNASATQVAEYVQAGATPAAGHGFFERFALKSSTVLNRDVARVTYTWATATDAVRKGRVVHAAYDTAARECLRLEASGSAPMVGVLGAAAVARQTVTGSRGGNAALASLLTALAAFGWVTDSTTA